jgi:hypothetical protein
VKRLKMKMMKGLTQGHQAWGKENHR